MLRNVITPKPELKLSIIGDPDSYKYSHWNQYPKGATRMMSYFCSRGGKWDSATLFGLQKLLHDRFTKPLTEQDVYEEEAFALAHGEPFNTQGFLAVVKKYGGKPPIRIRALPEGTVVPVFDKDGQPAQIPLMTVESLVDDKDVFWFANYLENKLSRLWGPSSIAIQSREIKKMWKHYLDLSSDTPEEIVFKHHDFGSRGVPAEETAMYHGAAHLLSFLGSDTVAGIKAANYYYDCPMAGFSIPATEHSTMTPWGEAGELDALLNYIDTYLTKRATPPGVPKLAACVGDSWNIFNFVRLVCSDKVLPIIEASGGTLVIRPDSGDPITVLSKIFDILEECLGDKVTLNKKGYKLLPPYLRVIQGDGIDSKSADEILNHLVNVKGWSASNIAFGSGGGLLQKINRDTQKYAFKCCFMKINGVAVDVRKNPITDPGKQSRAGRLDVIKVNGEYVVVTLDDHQECHPNSEMNTVYECGDILYHTTFDECRARMAL